MRIKEEDKQSWSKDEVQRPDGGERVRCERHNQNLKT